METLLSNEHLGLIELDADQQKNVDGGFFPLVILGVYISSKIVAGVIVTAFVGGVAAGVAIAASE